MKRLIKKCIFKILSKLPLIKVILFESIPDFSDNTRAVYDEMVKRGLDKKYKLVWISSDSGKSANKNKFRVVNVKTVLGNFKCVYLRLRAKCIICCNRFIRKKNEKTPSFYLTHGTPSKSTRNYYTIPGHIDYCIVPSDGVAEIYSYHLNFPIEKIYPLGFPRNDDLYRNVDIKTPLGTSCDKIVVWYPTFRQMKKNLVMTASTHALPVIHDAESAKRLNEVAAKNNTLIVLKPHFAQDVSYVKDLGLSNIRFIDDSFFTEHGMTSYQFVGSCDALITDYSSIYYDFTLCDKPIAAIWEDIEEYKQNPGLIDNFEYYMKGAEKVYTADELGKFISDVANGIDNLKEERNEIKNLTNYSTDGRNAERVVDFIIEKAKLRGIK